MSGRENDRELVILYGSETGTAEEVAEGLARDASRRHFSVDLCSLDSFNINKLLHCPLVLFVCSTTGQGDPPSNMKKFWRFIMRRNLPSESLNHLKFAVIGLGDSSYQKLPSKYKILPSTGSSFVQNTHSTNEKLRGTHPTSPLMSRLISNDRLTAAEHFQDVRLVRLDITKSSIQYDPGDVAYIRPQNCQANVQQFLRLLSLNGEDQIEVEPIAKGHHLPDRLQGTQTWREMATHYLDLSSIPRRYFFELMSHFSNDELEKEKLQEFCSPEGQDERFAYCNRVRRTVLEVLSEFRHTTPNIPINYILDLIPALQPRAFSIASDQQTDRGVVELLVAVVKYKTKLSDPRLGICSNWLAGLSPSNGETEVCNAVPLWTQKSTLRFPSNGEPCILIGPGTGVAPFRSFIRNRASKKHCRNMLIFGSRHRKDDFLCANEWESLTSTGYLTLLTAFSRDQEDKYYVWNAMLDNSELIWQWLHHDGAYVFIAGNAKRMPDDVRSSFVKIVSRKLDLSAAGAEEYMLNLEKTGRYQLECW